MYKTLFKTIFFLLDLVTNVKVAENETSFLEVW